MTEYWTLRHDQLLLASRVTEGFSLQGLANGTTQVVSAPAKNK